VFWSLLYLVLRRIFQLIVLLGHGERAKEIEILALRHQVAVLRLQVNPVRAENRIHGSDQQSCSADAPPVMITDYVSVVRVPADYATSRVAAPVRA
jgi:hypothetical protein